MIGQICQIAVQTLLLIYASSPTLRWCRRNRGYRREFKVICRRTTSPLVNGILQDWMEERSQVLKSN
ncbi:hypothetical protein IQ259_21000 [Fortiea sp. LEGE XX443]|uniref:hypothetical protein n=1 Tax=Fortiea sp. LEGE XX443 TaxID=1828611 RepID=UPI00187FD543|nr:hypothetical protein [Fortiea sp. LEGE XX443]MBE9007476.1 hypothetical protein [Fortiea sp. LEGE XX443]